MVENNNGNVIFCHELPTSPLKGNPLILVTGASGYIGGRLVPELIARGYSVRIMVRVFSEEYKERWPDAELVVADAADMNKLLEALNGVDIAYYLIHSLQLGNKKFESKDLQVADNFRVACEKQSVKRIVYLGGLGKKEANLSPHLESRLQVAGKLSSGNVPLTMLRAGMIIGSGSASYEILNNLVQNTPIFFIPKWAKTKSQPISIRAVLMYLIGVIEVEETKGKTYDIGGPDILTYDEMLIILARILGKKRYFFPGFITNKALYGYVVSLLTPVPGPITKALIEGCKNEAICENGSIKEIIDIELFSFNTSITKALTVEQQDRVSTRWSDAYPPAHDLAMKLHELNYSTRFRNSYQILSKKLPAMIFNSFCKIGGKNGWFQYNWMWQTTGAIDRIMLGVGSARGRRSFSTLRVNDVIDYWRVENIISNKSLLLRAEMKLPGKVWLRFDIDEGVETNKFSVNLFFQPKGIFGYLYWYIFRPFHYIIFKNLLKKIEQRS